jgi:hypothetical protein
MDSSDDFDLELWPEDVSNLETFNDLVLRELTDMPVSKAIEVVTKDKPPITAKHISTNERKGFSEKIERVATVKHDIETLSQSVSASHFQFGTKIPEIHIFEVFNDNTKRYLYTLKDCEVVKSRTDFGPSTFNNKSDGTEEFEFSYQEKVIKETMDKWTQLRFPEAK